jgi:hypothetical protein
VLLLLLLLMVGYVEKSEKFKQILLQSLHLMLMEHDILSSDT